MLQRLLIFLFFIVNFSSVISAQPDTSHIRVSLLTCQPGEELYSTFGHSALRITDSMSHDDIVFNYGTFDFSEPGFYTKFIRGKLTFYLSTDDYNSFLSAYREENRGITEQVLNLGSAEKIRIVHLLLNNLNGANKFYKYDFTFDNCTTRLRDLIEKTADTTIFFGNVLSKKTGFRQLIYEYLDYNDHQWSKLGIDLLLGSKLDAGMTNRQAMFLPEYLMKTLNHTKIGSTPVVLSSQDLFVTGAKNNPDSFITHPEFIFSILFILIVLLGFSKNSSVQKFISNFDGFMFFIMGLLGILILFMWFGTDHVMCKDNYNLIWALPSHSVAAFYINKHKIIVKNYFKLTALINTILLLLWFFLPQHFNISTMPVVMLLLFRSAAIGYKRSAERLNG